MFDENLKKNNLLGEIFSAIYVVNINYSFFAHLTFASTSCQIDVVTYRILSEYLISILHRYIHGYKYWSLTSLVIGYINIQRW